MKERNLQHCSVIGNIALVVWLRVYFGGTASRICCWIKYDGWGKKEDRGPHCLNSSGVLLSEIGKIGVDIGEENQDFFSDVLGLRLYHIWDTVDYHVAFLYMKNTPF